MKGKSIHWSSLSRLVDTRPLMAFIIISIFSFIICMSYAIRITPISSSDGRVMSSYCSCPASCVAFFLVFLLLPVSCQGVAIIPLFIFPFVMLVVRTLFIPLSQLLLQLLIALDEPLDCNSEGLHLSFQGPRWVPSLLVDGSH